MLGYSINKEDVKLIEKVNYIKTEFTDTVCNIYINASMTYGVDEYYLVGRIFKDYKAQGNYTYINGIEKEYKGVKPVLNAINKYADSYNCLGIEMDKILIFAELKKDIKETRVYKKIIKEQASKEVKNNSESEKSETDVNSNTIKTSETSEVTNQDQALTDIQQKQLDYKIQKSIEGEAFEMAMSKMNYKTLDDLHRDKNNKSLVPMYLTKYEEFRNRVKQYEEQLKNDANFIEGIKQAFIDDVNETNKIREYEAKVWVTEDKNLTLDELKYKYANDAIAEDKYKKFHNKNQNSAITQTTEDLTQKTKTNINSLIITENTIQQQTYTHTEVFQDKTLSAYDCNQKLYNLYENNLIKLVLTEYELECIKSNNESYYNKIDGIIKQIDWQKHLMLIDRDLNYLDKLYKLEERLIRIKDSYLAKYHEFKINKPVEKELKYKNYKDVFFNYIGFDPNDTRFRDDLIKHLLNKDNFEGTKDSYIRLKEKAQTQPDILESEGYKQFDMLVNKLEPIFATYGNIDSWMETQVI